MDDFDDLLPRLNALDDLRAERLGFDILNKVPRDLEIDIGLEQGRPHFAQGVGDIAFRDFSQPRKLRNAFCSFWLNESNMRTI